MGGWEAGGGKKEVPCLWRESSGAGDVRLLSEAERREAGRQKMGGVRGRQIIERTVEVGVFLG